MDTMLQGDDDGMAGIADKKLSDAEYRRLVQMMQYRRRE